ncbi:MAG: hypothetical protein GXY40_03835 [Syntrophomonadaceae bacterium]|nr:hypothetical protein [Syntrophomonadaceae bacterium]
MYKADYGVDHWYWKAYIETYKRDKQFPPVLPQYVLDEFQWYPPLFPLFIALLPVKVFNVLSQWIAIGIDLLRMIFLLFVVAWLSQGNMQAVCIAGLIYATTPILISYNIQLNPRGLGALFLDLLIVLVMYWYLLGGTDYLLIPVILLSGLILITHKMTTQIFWFLCLSTFIITLDYKFLLLVPVSVIAALLTSKGFYWKVLRAHWDIMTFWYRNWPWLQAHPIKESPVYGGDGYETPTTFHRKGWNGFVQHIRYMAGFNPAAWCLVVLLLLSFSVCNPDLTTKWIMGWMGISLLFVFLTVFIPQLKCLGAGYLYLYNATFPVALLWGFVFNRLPNNLIFNIILMIALLANVVAIVLFYRRLFNNKTQKIDADFLEVIDFLTNAPMGTVMCLPPQWYDVIAYKTNQPVLYGGHGYGFKLLEPVFPRLLIPMNEIVKRYGVRYLVSMEGYLTEGFQLELKDSKVFAFGIYSVYVLD